MHRNVDYFVFIGNASAYGSLHEQCLYTILYSIKHYLNWLYISHKFYIFLLLSLVQFI